MQAREAIVFDQLRPGDLIAVNGGNVYRAVEPETDASGAVVGWDVDAPGCDGPRLYVPRSRAAACWREHRSPARHPGLWRDGDGTLWLNDGNGVRAVWTARDGWGDWGMDYGTGPFAYVDVPGVV